MRISSLILTLILLLTFVSCKSKDKSDKYDGLFSGEEADWIAEHEYATYAVVLSSGVTSAVYDAAHQVAEKLSENTGAYAECFYAHEEIPSGEDVCRILVGDTGLEASRKYLRGFRAKDIGYKYHDKCVYIGGITEDTLLAAIEKFTDEVVDYADREFFMNENTSVFVRGKYAIEEIKLDGFSLGEYTLVYPNGDASLKETANDFSDKILSQTGYLLPVCNDAELSAESRVILLGNCDAFDEHRPTFELDKVKIVGFDAGVMLASEQPLAISAALEMLVSKLLAVDYGDAVDVVIDEPIEMTVDTADVSVLSFSSDGYALSRSVMVSMVEKIGESYPDIVRFERVSRDSVESLLYNFDDKYALVALSNDTYHFIRKDRYGSEIVTSDGIDAVKYSHLSQNTVLGVVEIGDPSEEALAAFCPSLEGGAALVFSDAELSEIDGIRSASELFDASNTSGIDTLYFSGETLAPTSYTVTETTGYTYSYTALKIISFN